MIKLSTYTNIKIEELKNESLVRDYKLSIPTKIILDKVEEALIEEQKTFKLAGFRDGKVPLPTIKKKIGSEVMGHVIEKETDLILRDLFKENNINPALSPDIKVLSFDEATEFVFTVHVELLPKIPEIDWSKIELDVVKVKISDEDVTKAHEDIIKNFKNFSEAPDTYSAKKEDAVIIDFVGKIDDVEFEGGKGEGVRLELGSGQFIPGFEEQLIGAKSNMNLKVRVVFPKNYNNTKVAGKLATFDVKVNKILKPESVDSINDEFAKNLGVESLEKLNTLVKQKLESDFNGLSRLRLKKLLFDKVDSEHQFDIPPSMVDIDFNLMWKEIKSQKENNSGNIKNKTEEELRTEYMNIARRRVKLGILLAELANLNKIEVEEADLQQAVYAEALLRPGQEKLVLDFYSTRENLERLKGPILEEKVVDYILSKITKKEHEVTSKEFYENYSKDLQEM